LALCSSHVRLASVLSALREPQDQAFVGFEHEILQVDGAMLSLGLLAAAALAPAFVPETVTRRERPSLRFAGLTIPADGRREFIRAGRPPSPPTR
jgi:hypothetical protein